MVLTSVKAIETVRNLYAKQKMKLCSKFNFNSVFLKSGFGILIWH